MLSPIEWGSRTLHNAERVWVDKNYNMSLKSAARFSLTDQCDLGENIESVMSKGSDIVAVTYFFYNLFRCECHG